MRAVRAAAVVWAVAAGTACTKPNPEVCCTTAEQCFALGVEDLRPCDDGLTCVENRCEVASCATDGCAASAPVCDLASGACAACATADDCARFDATPSCSPTSGGCVACVTSDDCTAAAPICENEACRACSRGDECPSGACDLDGSCVAEADVLYVGATGVDTADCTRAQPCGSISDGALPKTTVQRRHIVLLPGTVSADFIRIDVTTTVASRISLHGLGATLTGNSSEFLLTASRPVTISDLSIVYPGAALSVKDATLRNTRVRANQPLQSTGIVVATDTELESTGSNAAILVSSGGLTLKNTRLRGGSHGIEAVSTASTTLDLQNVLIFGTSREGIAASMASGEVAFTTIADTGISGGTGRGLTCGPDLNVRSSIIWAPNNASAAPIAGGCTITSSIAGPVAVAGALNVDPLFVGAAARDYHLQAGSPAIDQVPQGPAVDLDGEARPKGVMFDLGADEAF